MIESKENEKGLYFVLLSIHGLVRSYDMELGRDPDTGGQVKYVVELASKLSEHPSVARVDLLTRQIFGKEECYENPVEEINEKASLIRIPCGPKRYLRKEKLWPHLDTFTDHALRHIREVGRIPDVIHGHYADAGYVGSQLSRLLGVTFAFTGHSLGRVKKQSLIKKKESPERLEKKYKFKKRIEAEELALDTASLVVASTNQEIEEQYKLYDHYVTEDMNVIPPGVDLERFSPPSKSVEEVQYTKVLKRFLNDINKPIVLEIARPDAKKNFETLVKAFGEHQELKKIANLVLIAGNRDELSDLSSGARRVLRNLMILIDKYDLYGSVAYPKHHSYDDDIPDLYRIAASTKGVFVNPAFNEPFGLTLIEAAASGLPMVATNDGGPRDILDACSNGVLIDPDNSKEIGESIYSAITDQEKWKTWSENGIKGSREHYSWESHVKKYVRKIEEILNLEDPKNSGNSPRSVGLGRLTVIDRILVINIDEVLVGDTEGLEAFYSSLKDAGNRVAVCLITRASTKHAKEVIEKFKIPMPDVLITSAGSEIFYGRKLVPDVAWEKHINHKWNPEEVHSAVSEFEGIEFEQESEHSFFKVSFKKINEKAPRRIKIKKHLRKKGISANVISPHGLSFDILPIRNSLNLALRYLLFKWGVSSEKLLVAGSSGLEEEIFGGNTLGVVVKPYSSEIKHLKKRSRVYFTEKEHAWGLLEGIDYYNFFGDMRIPNEDER